MLLGVDVGGVITGRDDSVGADPEAHMFGLHYLNAPANEFCFEVLHRLNAGLFTERVYLISKGHQRMQSRMREWLHHVSFHEATGIPPGRWRFVLERADKVPVCTELGVAHFVDDHEAVLQLLRSVVPSLYLMTGNPKYGHASSFYTVVGDWPDFEAALHGNVTTG